jgi:thiamine-phosphate pyrophosphorylase
MPRRQPHLPETWPEIWLLSDARNDARLESRLLRLPRGSGLIFRHYHLDPGERRARFDRLARLARARGHRVVLAGTARQARQWRADGCYCAPAQAGAASGRTELKLLTAHNLREIGAANRMRGDAILLSPVFATRSHPGGAILGPVRFRLLARNAAMPVIALGGLNPRRARSLAIKNWAAIDGI